MITNIELVLSIYTVLDSVKSNYTLYMYVIYSLWHLKKFRHRVYL